MTANADETAVRAYLRAVVGAPERPSETLEGTEPNFVAAAARWAAHANVDRKTLLRLGVPRAVIDRANIAESKTGDLVRWMYTSEPFSVKELCRRACVSAASVRTPVLADERAGLLERVPGEGRAHRWRKVQQ